MKSLINYYLKKGILTEIQIRDDIKDILDFQNHKLNKLLQFCKSNNQYYSPLLSDKITDPVKELNSLPFLTKKLIKDNFELLQSKGLPKNRFRINSTSGSTGNAIQFYSDNKTHKIRNACSMRGDSWTGWIFGKPIIILWGATHDIGLFGSVRKRLMNSRILFNTKLLSSFDMTDEEMYQYIHIINRNKPLLIVGYPSSLELFSNYIHKQSWNIHSPKGIITSGESLNETQRQIIQDTFNCKVLNRYGCREVGHIANECQMQSGLHISSDHVIVEVVNDKGEQCKPGELGEIIVTDLDNYVFPIIKYKIGDIGILSNSECECGRKLPMLQSVEGRSFDMIVGVNGNRVPGNFFTLLRYDVKGVEQFQVNQDKYGELTIKIKTNSDWNSSEGNKLTKIIKEKLGTEMKIHISFVDNFMLNKSGKFQWVTSNVSPFS